MMLARIASISSRLCLRPWGRLPKRSRLHTASFVAGTLPFAGFLSYQVVWPHHAHCIAEEPPRAQRCVAEALEETALTKSDQAIVSTVLDEILSDILALMTLSKEFWASEKSYVIAGLEEVIFRMASPSPYPAPLFVGSAIYPGVTLAELLDVTNPFPGGKDRFDPQLRGVKVMLEFAAPAGTISLLRTQTNPAMLGFVSSRESDDWTQTLHFKDGTIVRQGIGNGSPAMQARAADSATLQEVMSAKSSSGEVRCMTYVSGFLLEPLDDEARGGGRGRWRLSHWLAADAGGRGPTWAAREGTKKALLGFLRNAHKEILQQRKNVNAS